MSRVIQVSLDDQGHILIPAALQRQLGLSPGMTLVVEEADNRRVLLLAPLPLCPSPPPHPIAQTQHVYYNSRVRYEE
jgi:bifunctional DNA-binding transcriptional regulator/antitoxin component of YhaV-PrlF toxin-antitoxin module